jgi:hypothetical protein
LGPLGELVQKLKSEGNVKPVFSDLGQHSWQSFFSANTLGLLQIEVKVPALALGLGLPFHGRQVKSGGEERP